MTILIKGGLVYDGSGDEPVKEDVLVRGGTILRRGNFPKSRADRVIDAMGAMVTPGFVDINSPADHYLSIFENDFGNDHSKDGVTTVIGGNCGASLAPVAGQSFLSLRKWTDVSKLNFNWHEFPEFFDYLVRQGLNINFGTLIGHGTIRRALIGDDTRDLTDNELRSAKKILNESLKDGVLGFSTGLEFAHVKSAPAYEIEELVKIVSEKKRIYATHLRNYGSQLEESAAEAIQVAKKTGVNLEISHFKPTISEARSCSLLREKIEEEGAKLRINFDCNSLNFVPMPIYQFLPEWLREENLETMFKHLNAKHLEEKILEHLTRLTNENISIGEAPPHLNFLVGKNLRDYAVDNNLTPAKALLKLMKISNLRGVLLKQTVEENLIDDFVFSPSSFIASGEMKDGKTFLRFLKLVDKTRKISMEKAVQKLTSLPAGKYGLKNRGKIKEGYYADLLVIKDFTVKDAVVNGAPLVAEGKFQNSRSGKIIRYEK